MAVVDIFSPSTKKHTHALRPTDSFRTSHRRVSPSHGVGELEGEADALARLRSYMNAQVVREPQFFTPPDDWPPMPMWTEQEEREMEEDMMNMAQDYDDPEDEPDFDAHGIEQEVE